MRYSQYLLPTLKETPADAEVISHQLMMRAGMIRKAAAGIYSYMPFGLRSIRKMEQIIREEMNKAGAIECLMPMANPAELWQESGRWEKYGKELLRFKDRKETDFCMGPTHEEVITDIIRNTVNSYRQLPLNLYQIQTKFRDEIRPRFGLMRGREFIMKDAYSFDLDDEGADKSYSKMYQAYRNIFNRCGLKFRSVEADSGAIGGSFSHEFMVLAESGEDGIVSCDACEYAANVEKAELVYRDLETPAATAVLQRVDTPGQKTIEDVAAFLQMDPNQLVKTLIVQTSEDKVLAVLLRGDRELNEIKLANKLGVDWVLMAEDDVVKRTTGAPTGFAGPIGLKIPVIADAEVRGLADFVVGGNAVDVHYTGANLNRDFAVSQFADVRQAVAGDPCPRCDCGKFESWRGIEVGHVFKLGTKYSDAMNATVLDDQGKTKPLVMGCYGIGVGRTVAAAIEQNHDEYGMMLPMPLAPFQVLISVLNPKDDQVREASEQLYQQLLDMGIEVLLDDRDERPGIKFKDADLIGIPLRVTVGARNLKEGNLELKERASGEQVLVPFDQLAKRVQQMVDEALFVSL
ncbi:MAG: proline--tRNA ligase [Deltaproteobacteria bacterium]|nr:proline--tRNA ligase [Deltaproteobacteria bacterium]MCW8893625.1 proline--tRNA ligase [Deltaproteobacteria bacterium]MCW9049874.1 proline--tRNA ligase [Deltaproteobacteria bacterium]